MNKFVSVANFVSFCTVYFRRTCKTDDNYKILRFVEAKVISKHFLSNGNAWVSV